MINFDELSDKLVKDLTAKELGEFIKHIIRTELNQIHTMPSVGNFLKIQNYSDPYYIYCDNSSDDKLIQLLKDKKDGQ